MVTRRGIGVIGLGMGALPHGKSLEALADRIDVRGVFSPTAERRNAFAERFGLPAVDHLDIILDDPEISAVLLLTPPNARHDLVGALASRGKHILMEKPIERTTDAATAIVDRCAAAGIRLGIVFQHRFRHASTTLRQKLETGELGAIRAVQLNVPWWRGQHYYDEPGRGTYTRDGGGVLISQAIHSMDLMLSLVGPVDEVSAIAGTTALHRMESEDFVGGGLRFANGALGSIMATTAFRPGGKETITLVCDKGTASLKGNNLTIHNEDGSKEEIGELTGSGGGADPMAFSHEWHQRVIEHFLDALDNNQEPNPNGRDALAVHRLIDALLLSAHEERHIRLDHIRPDERS